MEDEENITNNFACIIINFKHESNNNIIKEENNGNDKVIENKDKEDKNTKVINSDNSLSKIGFVLKNSTKHLSTLIEFISSKSQVSNKNGDNLKLTSNP